MSNKFPESNDDSFCVIVIDTNNQAHHVVGWEVGTFDENGVRTNDLTELAIDAAVALLNHTAVATVQIHIRYMVA